MAEHPLQDLIEAVEVTHRGLGRLAAISALCLKAKKCLLVVSPPGCGKSTVTNWLATKYPESLIKDSITRSSLKQYEKEFRGFTGALLFDDVGKIDTPWSRVQTLVTMAEMVHGHFVSKDSFQLHIEIDDFYGSSILNIQPTVLQEVMEHPTWHSNLADKSIRYYHLKRAVMPTREGLDLDVDWGLDLAEVDDTCQQLALWPDLLEIGLEQWTRARAIEHTGDMLRATAAMGSNPTPSDLDAEVLLDLFKPLTVEMEVMEQQGFGTRAELNVNLLYLLSEFASYRNVTYEIIATDMRMRPRKVATILEGMIDWYEKIGTNPVVLQPTKRLEQLLERAGIR